MMNLGTFLNVLGVLDYFAQSNAAGKCIILALLGFSLIAWTLMIGKYIELKRLRSVNHFFEDKVNSTETLVSTNVEDLTSTLSPYAVLVKGASDAYYQHGGKMNAVENSLSRDVARQSTAYEDKMVILGSIVSGAPFLGLLGTVWGVMDAFGSVGAVASVSLQQLAPGVSGALLTTVAALLVAIPSVFGYNFLLTRVKQMVIELENFASCVADRIESEISSK